MTEHELQGIIENIQVTHLEETLTRSDWIIGIAMFTGLTIVLISSLSMILFSSIIFYEYLTL